MQTEEYDGIVQALYAAAVQSELWPKALEQVADAVGGSSGWLAELDLVRGAGFGATFRMDPDAQAVYSEQFSRRDPLSNVDDPRRHLSTWAPTICTDEDLITKDRLVRTEFYNDFMRVFDVHSVLMIRFARRGDSVCTLNINRPERLGQFDGAALDVARRLLPHLSRAVEITTRMNTARRLEALSTSAMNTLANAVILVDGAGVVQYANRKAEDLLREPSGLRRGDGRLSATAADSAERLSAAIRAATRPDPGQPGSTGSMVLAPAHRSLPMSVQVSPLRLDGDSPAAPEARLALVTVSDLETPLVVSEQRLAELFHFTPAEARVSLALLDGCGPREVADRLGISFHTVRNQLQRVYEKTGTNRQADLVKLLTRAAAMG